MAVVAAIFSIEPPGDIIEITIFSGSLYAVVFSSRCPGTPLAQRVSLAVLWSMFLGISTLFVWLLLDLKETLHEVFPALLAIAYSICCLLDDE